MNVIQSGVVLRENRLFGPLVSGLGPARLLWPNLWKLRPDLNHWPSVLKMLMIPVTEAAPGLPATGARGTVSCAPQSPGFKSLVHNWLKTNN